jgi:hypothetical protein
MRAGRIHDTAKDGQRNGWKDRPRVRPPPGAPMMTHICKPPSDSFVNMVHGATTLLDLPMPEGWGNRAEEVATRVPGPKCVRTIPWRVKVSIDDMNGSPLAPMTSGRLDWWAPPAATRSSPPCGATIGGRSPDASELEPTRRDQGHLRIALNADPFASQGRGDPADRSRAGEGIEDGPALPAAFKHRPDHGLRDRVPNTVRVGAREWQHPAQRASARLYDLPQLPEAQEIVDAVVPALPRACLGPEAARLKPPAGTTEPAGDECVHPHPLGAVVAIADHQPEVAVGREDAFPFTPEAHGQVVRVTLGRQTPPPSHPVRRRGQDHSDTARRDQMEAVAVPAEQAQPPIPALVASHGGTITRPARVGSPKLSLRGRPSRAARNCQGAIR